MLRPSEITPGDLGDELAAVIPGKDPELSHPEWGFTINRIPVSPQPVNIFLNLKRDLPPNVIVSTVSRVPTALWPYIWVWLPWA